MKRKIIWLVVSCLIVSVLVLASCTPAVTGEEEVALPTEEAKPPAEVSMPEVTPPAGTVSPVSTAPMPRGTLGSDLQVDVYRSDMAWAGTTLLADNHNPERPRIIEVNMLGEIIWEYLVPKDLRQYTNPGFDTEWLPNNNILFVLPRNGVYEIERNGSIVWSYLDNKVSHDADRLPNGNTLITGATKIVEVTPEREIVWQLRLKGVTFGWGGEAARLGFYKAERIGIQR